MCTNNECYISVRERDVGPRDIVASVVSDMRLLLGNKPGGSSVVRHKLVDVDC